jgi:4-hydroxybenzoate polyprenyltransferase
MVRLVVNIVCVCCFALLLAPTKQSLPLPISLIVLIMAAMASAALELMKAQTDRRGDEEYLSRQLAGKRVIWIGEGAWGKGLILLSLLLLSAAFVATWRTEGPWLSWCGLGFYSGKLVGYPHWRKHWQRLRELAAIQEERFAALVGSPDGPSQDQ